MNKTLETLLKPVKALDEAILKQYTRLTKKWEASGKSRYSLAHAFQLPTWITNPLSINYVKEFGNFRIGYLVGSEAAINVLEPVYKRDITDNRGITKSYNPVINFFNKIEKGLRFPLFISGVGLMAKGGFDFIRYFRNKDPLALNEALGNLSLGYTFLGNASSMYVKESDPKLLDKEPAWKRLYSSLKEKASNLIPRPIPQPQTVPISNYRNSIENYVIGEEK